MLPFLYDSQYFSIQTVWVFAVIALLAGSYLAIQRLKRARVNFTLFIEHSGFFFLTAVIFSRVTFFVLHTDTYFPGFDLRTLVNFLSIWDQGFSFWGGLLGFTLAFLYRIHKSEENKWKWMDAFIVPLIVGMGIGSLGNFLSGTSYGNPTDLPWGVTYELYNVIYTVPIHPVQLYELIFLILLLMSKRWVQKKTHFFQTEGNATLYYLTWLSLGFFGLEFFRGDDTLLILGVRLSMILFFLLFLPCAWVLSKHYNTYKHTKHDQPS